MTELLKPSRRSFITGLAALITAPAIVRAGSLMPVKVMEWETGNYVIMPSQILRIKIGEGPWMERETKRSPSGHFDLIEDISLEWSGSFPTVQIAFK